MGKPMIDPSLSDKEKIDKLTKIVERLGRRSRKTAKAIITPYPISNCITGEDVKGPILHYMFSCSGTFTKGLIDIGTKLSSGAMVRVYVGNKVKSETKEYTMNRDTFLFEPNMLISSGDKVIISISPNSVEDKITEAWVSFLWIPSMKEVDVKQFLIEELDKIDVLEE